MLQKFTANGEDVTDLFYWEPTMDTVRSGGVPSTLSLFPFSDKAKMIVERFERWGTFVVEYFGSAGRVGYSVVLQGSDLSTKRKSGHDVALIALRIVARA